MRNAVGWRCEHGRAVAACAILPPIVTPEHYSPLASEPSRGNGCKREATGRSSGLLAESRSGWCGWRREPNVGLHRIVGALRTWAIGRLKASPSSTVGIAICERDSDRFAQSELYRLRGELLLLDRGTGAHDEAERLFERAIDVAHCQGARLFELLATMSLCRLRYEAGRRRTRGASCRRCGRVDNRGPEYPTLSEARALLNAMDWGRSRRVTRAIAGRAD